MGSWNVAGTLLAISSRAWTILFCYLFGAFSPFTATLWISRAAVVVISLITPIALYRVGKILFNRRLVAGVSALIYTVIPFSFFMIDLH